MTYVKRSDGAYCAYSMTLADIVEMLAAQGLTCEQITKDEYMEWQRSHV